MLDKYKILQTAEKLVLDRKFSQAVGEYRKLLEKDPNEPTLLNTVGDLLVRQQQPQEALNCFRQVADIYLSGGFTVKAQAMLKKILQVAPDDLRSRETLVDLFEKQGLTFEAARQLRYLTDHYRAVGRSEKALMTLKRLTGVVPHDPLPWRERAALLVEKEKPELAISHFSEAMRLYQEKDDFEAVLETALEALACDASHREILHLYVEAAEKSDRLEEAEDFLNQQINVTGKPFPFLMFMALIHEKRGNSEKAGEVYKSLQSEGFSDSLILEGLARTGHSLPVEETEDQVEIDLPGSDELFDEPVGPAENDVFSLDEEPLEQSAEPESPEPSSADSWEIPLEAEDSARQEETESSGLFSVEEMSSGSTDSFTLEPSAQEDLFEQADLEEIEDFENEAIRVETPDIASLEEALEEVDFYLKLGFRDDGKELVEKLLTQYPADERVLRRAAKVGISPAAAKPPPEPSIPAAGEETAVEEPAPPLGGDFEDEIESALGDLFSDPTQQGPADEVLRYEVAPRPGQVGDTSEIHYDLGLAYKEMGLFDDAVQEFVKAFEMLADSADNPQKLLCCSMLASCCLQGGKSQEAIRWARQGLSLPESKDFERRALEYDLACALQNLGETEEAMRIFEKIVARNAGYRDVGDRLQQLRTSE